MEIVQMSDNFFIGVANIKMKRLAQPTFDKMAQIRKLFLIIYFSSFKLFAIPNILQG